MITKHRRIIILGNTEVGKTTYLISAYTGLQSGWARFTLRADDQDQHAALVQLGTAVAAGRYPSGTARHQTYSFQLFHDSRTVVPFTWSDYSGRMIFEDPSNSQAQLLHDEIDQADGIIVFFESETLASGRLSFMELAQLFAFLSSAARDVKHPLAVTLVLTKADRIRQYTAHMLRPFEDILDTLAASTHVRCVLVPIACGTSMVNIPHPLLYALHSLVERESMAASEAATANDFHAARLQRNAEGLAGLADWIYSRWNGYPTDGELAKRRRKEAQELREQAKHMAAAHTALIETTRALPRVRESMNLEQYASALNALWTAGLWMK